jgi:hypothetical protein
MHKYSICLFTAIVAVLVSGAPVVVRAEFSEGDQQAFRTQYVGKVLIFRKSFRMTSQLEIGEDGSVKGDHSPGFWATDGAVQVKDVEFRKDRVTFKCAKLWADIKDDGQLHFFPVSAALKGKTDYPENAEISFRMKKQGASAEELKQRVQGIFLGEQESILTSAPQPIAAYIQKVPIQVDVDPISGIGFSGTSPKALSNPAPDMPREAQLVGQAGRESFVVFVDEKGDAAVTAFTHVLQYGIEEATLGAVKGWKFQPAMKDGKPVAVRIPLSIDYKRPGQLK